MAVDKGPKLDWGIRANSDLRANQFMAVKFHGTATIDTVVAIAAVTDKPLGILNNAPNTGEAAEVVMFGVQKGKLGGTVARDDMLVVAADGRLVTGVPGTDTTKWIIGRALESGVANQIISVALSTPTAYLAK